MTGSKLHPRRNYKTGEEESGGYLFKNTGQKSASAPDWKGKFYLVGYGWIWLDGWSRQADGKPMIKLLSNDITDEKAAKYCQPREPHSAGAERRPERRQNGQEAPDSNDSEIPF